MNKKKIKELTEELSAWDGPSGECWEKDCKECTDCKPVFQNDVKSIGYMTRHETEI